MDNALEELRRLAAHAENRRTDTGIPRVAMVQGEIPEHALAAVYEPMINLILQGSKSMTVGEKTLEYDPATYFIMSVDLPAVGAVHPASTGEPYLAVSLTLDLGIIAALLCDTTDAATGRGEPSTQTEAFNVAAVTPELMDAWVRMLRLMERPGEIPRWRRRTSARSYTACCRDHMGACCGSWPHRIRRWRVSAARSSASVATTPNRFESPPWPNRWQ